MKAPIWYSADRTATQYETYSLAAVLNSFNEVPLPPVFAAVQKLLPEGAFIAGGYLTEVLLGLPRNDIDVWFSSAEAAAAFRETLRKEIRSEPWAAYKLHERVNTVTDASTFVSTTDHTVISLASTFIFKDITDALDSFDFTVTQLALTGDDQCYAGPTTIADIKSKRLVFHRIQPTFYGRTKHYLKKGFKLSDAASATITEIAPSLSAWTPPLPPALAPPTPALLESAQPEPEPQPLTAAEMIDRLKNDTERIEKLTAKTVTGPSQDSNQ